MQKFVYIIDFIHTEVYSRRISKKRKELSVLEEKKERKRMNITLPPELIEELEKVNVKYKINKSKQLETLVKKYLRKEYGDLG